MSEVYMEMGLRSENEPLTNSHTIENFSLDHNTKEIILKNLLDAVLNNKVEEIKNCLQLYPQTDDDLRYYRFNHELKDNSILVIACIDENVAASTLGTLFTEIKSKYGNIKYSDEKWYGWEPIHYIARTANADKLEALLNVLNGDVNTLTYFLENALHVLLQYEEYAVPFGVVLNNSRESKCATIIGTEKDTIEKCARMLIQAGIDVNQTNFWNETPICLAVRYRYLKLINLLLTVDSIDLDSFIESGKTIQEYLKWNLYITLPKSYIQEDPLRIRFNFLKSGDEESFLTYDTSTLSDNINSFDGDTCTMLQFCLRKGFLEYLQNDNYKIKRLNTYDIKDNPMLTVFKTKGLARCVIHLLDNGADTFIKPPKFKETLLEFSSLRGYYPFVAILLQHKNSNIEPQEIFDILSKLFSTQFKLQHHEFYRNCVLYLLLNKLVFLFRQDTKMLTPKRCNILNKVLYKLNLENDDKKLNDSENIQQILHLGASLTYMPESKKEENRKMEEDKNEMVVKRMDYSLLKTHFDDCIHGTTFNYNSIIQDNDKVYNENKTLHFLVTDTIKQQLLKHPLLIQLIRVKWSKIYLVFYVDLLFYTFLLMGIYWYTVCQYFGHYTKGLYICYWFLLIFHVVKESIQFAFLYRWKYFLDPPNILEIATIACCLTTIFLPNIYSAVGSILFSTFIFFLLLGQLPVFTKYTIIFSSINYFFQYMAFYSIQFVAFSICFYLVFPFENSDVSLINNNNTNITGPHWGDISKSLFYTLIYFTGEFSDRVLEPTDYPVFGRLIMTVFIFCMTIILNNLLVGLIVADMDDIQQSCRLYKEVKLASFIKSTNTFVKRLHDYKYFNFVKKIIKILDVFEKGHRKIIENVNIHKFDDENKKYLRSITKVQIFDRHMLKEVYNEVLKK